MILSILGRTKVYVILGKTIIIRFVRFLGWRPQIYQNIWKRICRHRGFQSELRADLFYTSESCVRVHGVTKSQKRFHARWLLNAVNVPVRRVFLFEPVGLVSWFVMSSSFEPGEVLREPMGSVYCPLRRVLRFHRHRPRVRIQPPFPRRRVGGADLPVDEAAQAVRVARHQLHPSRMAIDLARLQHSRLLYARHDPRGRGSHGRTYEPINFLSQNPCSKTQGKVKLVLINLIFVDSAGSTKFSWIPA